MMKPVEQILDEMHANRGAGPRPDGCHVKRAYNLDGDAKWEISVPSFLWGLVDADAVDDMRRAAIIRRDYWIALQKEFGADRNTDGARFAKGEAQDALKEYRGACLVLGQVSARSPGDAPFKRLNEWPVELAPWVDRVFWECAA